MTHSLKELEPAVIDLTRQAGKAILDVYETAFAVNEKRDNSPVTAADLAAHDVIYERLSRLTPDWPILSEEGDRILFSERKRWSHYWLIDPLDGTREFVKRNGEFAVIIALIEDGRAVLGVVFAPVLDVTYLASSGNGAYKQTATEKHQIRVRAADLDTLIVAGSRSHSSSRLGRYLQRLGNPNLLSMGSALKACLVAEGKADLYPRFGPTSEWDTAAAQCILEEAGGRMTDIQMRPLRYNSKASLTNPDFFAFGDDRYDWSRFLHA